MVGCPLPGVEIQIDSGSAQSGELLVKGNLLFNGYWQKEALTKAEFKGDYFRTGDTVQLIGDSIKILGRTSVDILKVGGYKISALDIESVLLTHPDIS
jgi:malonyl-CoA/methylmalonyl-CoA synthetase